MNIFSAIFISTYTRLRTKYGRFCSRFLLAGMYFFILLSIELIAEIVFSFNINNRNLTFNNYCLVFFLALMILYLVSSLYYTNERIQILSDIYDSCIEKEKKRIKIKAILFVALIVYLPIILLFILKH